MFNKFDKFRIKLARKITKILVPMEKLPNLSVHWVVRTTLTSPNGRSFQYGVTLGRNATINEIRNSASHSLENLLSKMKETGEPING